MTSADASPTSSSPVSPSRTVTAHLELSVAETSDLVLAIAVDGGYERENEHLSVSLDGVPIDAVLDGHLCFLHDIPRGFLLVDYQATVLGNTTPAAATAHDAFRYIRPSRYCESDRLGPLARAEFGGRDDPELVAAVTRWVNANIAYVSGSSRPTDGAVATLLGREGVCRDFAHLTAALLRANDVPARVVSVYAPGLSPMDFHVVTEARIDGEWYLVDPTGLAPREAMVRIATGVDASDVAFLTTLKGVVDLNWVSVSATIDGPLPCDDPTTLARLR